MVNMRTENYRKPSQRQLDLALAKARRVNRKDLYSTANYNIYDSDGRSSYSARGRACHGGLAGRQANLNDRVVVNYLRTPVPSVVDWLANDDSWWGAKFILNRETLAEDNFIAVSAWLPRHLVQFFGILSRLCSEYSGAARERFEKYYSMGFDGVFCAILCNSFYMAKDVVIPQSLHGSIFQSGRTFKSFSNFVNGNFPNLSLETFRSCNNYGGWNDMAGGFVANKTAIYFNQTLLKEYPDLREALSKFRKEQEEELKSEIANPFKVSREPFAQIKRDTANFTLKEWDEVVCSFFIEKGLFTRPDIVNQVENNNGV